MKDKNIYLLITLVLFLSITKAKSQEVKEVNYTNIQDKNKEILLKTKSCPDCNLSGQDLSGSDLRNSFLPRANLTDSKLIGSDLRGAYLSGAKLNGAILINADLRGSDLSYADFTNADLTYAQISEINYKNLEKICKAEKEGEKEKCKTYSRTNAYRTIFKDARLNDVDLERAFMVGSDLSGSFVKRSNLSDVDLLSANLCNAILSGVIGAELYDFSLIGNISSNLAGANLAKANLGGTDLRGVNFLGAKDLDFSNALFVKRAIDPEGNIEFLEKDRPEKSKCAQKIK